MARAWRIEPHHVAQVRHLVERGRDDPLVKYRAEMIVRGYRPEVTRLAGSSSTTLASSATSRRPWPYTAPAWGAS